MFLRKLLGRSSFGKLLLSTVIKKALVDSLKECKGPICHSAPTSAKWASEEEKE